MKASELIQKLQEIVKKHGDLPVQFSESDFDEETVEFWDIDAVLHGVDDDGGPATSIILMDKDTYQEHLDS